MTWKGLLVALAWITAAMVATLAVLWAFQRSLIYLPSRVVPPPPNGVEEVSYTTADGLTLTAWYVPGETGRGTIVVFNGNAGNRSHRLPLARAFNQRGFSVLLTDYRGYGDNPGSPSEKGLACDARSAIQFTRDRTRGGPVIYFGESLGAGVAIGLATTNPPDALILRSPFESLPDIAAVHYWWLPSSLLLKDRYPNVDRVSMLDAPVMVVAGSEDTVVPPTQSRAVYQASEQPKRLFIVEGAGHNDAALLDGELMIGAIMDFLEDQLST